MYTVKHFFGGSYSMNRQVYSACKDGDPLFISFYD